MLFRSINSDWETVPLVGRSLFWGLSVRKQTPFFSHIAQDKIKITAVASSGPFTVNSQNEPETTLKGGATLFFTIFTRVLFPKTLSAFLIALDLLISTLTEE